MSKINQQKMFDSILQWQQSGLTQKAWCEQTNMVYSSFHYWYKLFRNQHSGNEHVTNDGFVQLPVKNYLQSNPWCEVVGGNGKKVFFHQPLPAEFIRSLLD